MTNDFDITKARADLIALRTKHGADSPTGRRCSNLIEQLQNLETATGQQRVDLQKKIGDSVAELAALARGNQ